MSNAPFTFCSAAIIPPVGVPGKCAILFLFLPVQIPHRAGDLTQRHFGNVADSAAQDRQGFRGVEVKDMGKVLAAEILLGVDAAPGQHDIGHAVFQQALEPRFSIEVVQFFQQTALFDATQLGEVVAKVVLHDDLCRLQQALGKVRLVSKLAIAVLQRLRHRPLVLRLHLPDGDGAPLPAVGVGHIKDVPQFVAPVGVHQQGDPRGAPVHPAAIFVPEVDLSAGGGVRLLGKNQKLVTEAVLEVVGSGGQERHIIPAVGGDLLGGLCRKVDDIFSFVRQRLSLLFFVRFQQPFCGGGDFGDTPGELGDGGLYLRLPRRVEVLWRAV